MRNGNNPLEQLIPKEENTNTIPKEENSKKEYKKYPLNIPLEMHGAIKIKAFSSGKTMNELIIEILKGKYKL